MYKYVLRISVNDTSETGRNRICGILNEITGRREKLSMEDLWYYFYIEYDDIKEADKLVSTLLKVKEVQKEYPYNKQVTECFIVTNKLTL